MPEEQPPAADAEPVEAREVPPWKPGDGPMRARTWSRGGPVIEVYTGGTWRPARVLQRQDRQDVVTVHVMINPDPDGPGDMYRTYAWDPQSIRPVRPATADPVERAWP